MQAPTRCLVAFGIILLTLSLVACSSADTSGMLVKYHRSGGFAGIDDYLVIDTQGAANLTRHSKEYAFTVDPEALQQLALLLEQADFPTLQRRYAPSQEARDLVEYEITYKSRIVHMADTVVPLPLEPVLNALNRIIEGSNAQ